MSTAPAPTQIKQTEVRHRGFTVVTAQFHDPHALLPYKIFLINGETGHTHSYGDYTCAATALHAHDALVADLTGGRDCRQSSTAARPVCIATVLPGS